MRALLERQVAAAEQVHRHVERLLRVVVGLERVALRDAVIRLEQVDERLLELVRDLDRDLLLAEVERAEHVEDQHAVVREMARPLSEMIVGCGTPASSHTVWMWKTTSLAYSCSV